MRINCLEPQIYNKIAAGEVVERPASIVKELVENSVDAGSTIITVSIWGGGINEIKVEDNGKGIHYDDLERAFLPHATSKIQTEEDLFGIKTLGFRGEALASIASVSEVVLESHQQGAEYAGIIELSAGEIIKEKSISSRREGTTITVSNLFFNVPARQKFLKKPKTEEGEITSLMAKFILANPCIAFKYIVDGKIKYISTGKGMQDALFVVYGKEAIENTMYIEKDYGYIKIYGFIGKPSFSKPNRTYQTIIINNRVVTNNTIIGAVQSAYGEMLMKKQFPFFVLYMDLDYTKLDVNVHPNKMEVRFENSQDIYLKVLEVVNRKLNALDFSASVVDFMGTGVQEKEIIAPKEFKINETEENVEIVSSNEEKSTPISMGTTITPASQVTIEQATPVDYSTVNDNLTIGTIEQEKERRNIFSSMALLSDGEDKVEYGVGLGSRLLDELQQKIKQSKQESMLDSIKEDYFRVVGVLFKTYIIVERDDELLLIDQHAGHERLLYDKFIKQVKGAEIDVQPLFLPYVLSLNSAEDNFFQSVLPSLYKLGFDIEEFGERSYKVSSVPYLLADIKLKEFFDSILSDVKNIKTITIVEVLKDKLASMACKAAVKAGDELSQGEIKILLNEFRENGTKLLCPHGRPVVVKIERKELEKWFKRIV